MILLSSTSPQLLWDISYRTCQLPPYLESVSSQQWDAQLNLTSRNASLNTMIFFLMGMKDLTIDLWTLSIVGSAGNTSSNDTHDEQDEFDNLRDEFMERANVACSTMTSSLAVPWCASTQAYKQKRMNSVSLHTPSEPRPTASNLCINRCAAPKSRHSSKQSDLVF